MIALDTSVAVAAFASWHEQHRKARAVLSESPRLAAQVALETYAVLTRLPPPHRAPPALVAEFLAYNFPRPLLALPAADQRRLIRSAPDSGIVGGAIYDAQIAATAARAGALLVTLDRRALATYKVIGARVRLLA
ncbi:MAG: PIN domain-containing protein [Acidobacteria bacterium]|nr:PIN domain-containing protein [Acidobacteriota bacterium]